jgi:hypothetical protein
MASTASATRVVAESARGLAASIAAASSAPIVNLDLRDTELRRAGAAGHRLPRVFLKPTA